MRGKAHFRAPLALLILTERPPALSQSQDDGNPRRAGKSRREGNAKARRNSRREGLAGRDERLRQQNDAAAGSPRRASAPSGPVLHVWGGRRARVASTEERTAGRSVGWPRRRSTCATTSAGTKRGGEGASFHSPPRRCGQCQSPATSPVPEPPVASARSLRSPGGPPSQNPQT